MRSEIRRRKRNVVTTLVFGRSNDVGNTTLWLRCDNVIRRRDQDTTKSQRCYNVVCQLGRIIHHVFVITMCWMNLGHFPVKLSVMCTYFFFCVFKRSFVIMHVRHPFWHRGSPGRFQKMSNGIAGAFYTLLQ